MTPRKRLAACVIVLLPMAVAGFGIGHAHQMREQSKRTPASKEEVKSIARVQKVESISDINVANASFAELFDLLHSAAPEKRAEWFEQLKVMPKGPRQSIAMASFLKTLVQFDHNQAFALMAGISNRANRELAVRIIFHAAPAAAMPDLVTFFLSDSFKASRTTTFLGETLDEWELVDPVAVARFCDAHPKTDLPTDDLLYHWASIDPESALVWYGRQKEFPDTEDGQRKHSEAINGLIYGWYHNDKPAAIEFALAHADDEAFHDTLKSLALSLFLHSDRESKEFIDRLPTESLRIAAVNNLISFTTTGVFIGDPIPKEQKRPADVMAKWLITFPKQFWNDQMGSLAGGWEASDPASLEVWLNQQEAPVRDWIISEYCSSGRGDHPEKYLARALTINDPVLREQTLTKFANTFGSDAKESREALQKSALPQNQKAYLVSLIKEEDADASKDETN